MESIAKKLDMLIKDNGLPVFIEAEGRPSRLANFYAEYNAIYSPIINGNTDGIIVLDEDANKWGLELRLYLHFCPSGIQVTRNRVYRKEFEYRINDVDVILELFNLGYRIGLN
ncbi:hypothetical protein [Wujia sp.]|uniref:hypothetical protein n=1 Tax=Wujia sp. TaxID=2944172 RepID=UPI00205EB469|nr:MAG TPA: hypothetical protein [Caudoviricetes sp.]